MSAAALLEAFEVHSPDGIQEALAAGVSPVDPINGRRPIDHLIEGYLRSSRFAECIRVMLNAGAVIDDPLVEAVFLDDSSRLRRLVTESPQRVHQKLDLLVAFTSCRAVTPLHVCSEFNSIDCARLLLEHGADVNAPADLNSEGMGGQTPIFHAVNSILNYCRPVMELLVQAGADLQVKVNSLLWGESMSWQTVLYDVTPISYTQCGLYRQFHRREEDVYSNIQYLYRTKYGTAPALRNVPNRYLIQRSLRLQILFMHPACVAVRRGCVAPELEGLWMDACDHGRHVRRFARCDRFPLPKRSAPILSPTEA